MSSQPPTAKRKRENEDPETETAIINSKYWFDDGDIIIEAENTRFRVHRFMLRRHSVVFRDMFDIPQPSHPDQQEELDGCPLVRLSDNASDFEFLMSIFYDNVRECDMRLRMSFECCAAFLRLGKKYDIEYLSDEGLKRFQHQFPSTLAGWAELFHHYPGREMEGTGDLSYVVKAMALAHELSMQRALPAICLHMIQLGDTREILRELSTKDMPCTRLLMQCLEGRDKILRRIHQRNLDWACGTSSSPIPAKNCTIAQSCTSSRALAVTYITCDLQSDDADMRGIEIMDVLSLPSKIDELLCERCNSSLSVAVQQFREDLWKDLPSIFDLGDSWEDLKDF